MVSPSTNVDQYQSQADKIGFAEHIGRYDAFFPLLAAEPYSLHVTAYDQRGHGRTAYQPLTSDSQEVVAWKAEGRDVKVIKNGKRRTGGWGQVFHDMEFFVKRESKRAEEAGKKLFLWGHSMVSCPVVSHEQEETEAETIGRRTITSICHSTLISSCQINHIPPLRSNNLRTPNPPNKARTMVSTQSWFFGIKHYSEPPHTHSTEI